MAKDEREWELHVVEKWQQLNAEVPLAGRLGAHRLKTVHCVWLLAIDDEDFRPFPNTRHELLIVELDDASRVHVFEVALLKKHERVGKVCGLDAGVATSTRREVTFPVELDAALVVAERSHILAARIWGFLLLLLRAHRRLHTAL